MAEVCRFFLQGRCAFGTACRLAHPGEAVPPPPAAASPARRWGGADPGAAAGPHGGVVDWQASPPGIPVYGGCPSASASASTSAGSASTAQWPAAAAAEAEAEAEELRARVDAEIRESKKMQKAIREIETLEGKQAAGEGLQANQLKKIARRSECVAKLAEFDATIAELEAAAAAAEASAAMQASMPPLMPRPFTMAPIAPNVSAAPPGAPVCRHFVAGRCSFGSACRSAHATGSGSSAERHSADAPTRAQPTEPAFDVEDPECGICFESIRKKGERFGILVNCDHAFCLSCIRSWRKQREQQDRQNLRLCPVCRNESYFVIPSDDVILDPEIKQRAVEEFKGETARIPCKIFDYGKGKCPFGTSCFYAHLNPDGTRYVPPALQWRAGADGSEVQQEVKLSDFLARSLALS